MNRILVPVDFSVQSIQALNYASSLALKLGAKVVCIHAHAEDVSIEQLNEFVRNNSINAVAVDTVLLSGKLEDVVHQYTQYNPVDLIVMGTKGASGFQKVMGGSHTTDLLSSTTIPLMVIPEGYAFDDIRFILWASDFHELTNIDAFDVLIEIARVFDAEVRVAHVKTHDTSSNIQKHLEAGREHHLLSDEGIKHSFKKIKWDSITGGIRYYLELKADNDLLVMVRKKSGFMSRLFRQDHTYEFACNPVVPLLVLHD